MKKIFTFGLNILIAIAPIFALTSHNAKKVSAYTYQDPFHFNSIWNAPIPANAAVASNSAAMIQLVRNQYGGTNLPWTIAGVEQSWGVPVYYADSNTPRVRVCGNDGNYCTNNVPIASNFYPSPDSDAKIIIIETNANPQRAWSFWGFHAGNVNGSQYISDYGAYGWSDITDNGDGLTLNAGGQWGGRASGANYIGGLIDPEEIQAGVIDHALAISFTGAAVSENTRWWPARGGDGYSNNANAIPYGARIQLDPNFNVNSIPTTNGARAIARALQTYGAWVVDTGGSFALYGREFVNSNGTINRTPWNGLINSSEIESYIPWTSLRVLTQQNQNDFFPINPGNPVLTQSVRIPPVVNNTSPTMQVYASVSGTLSYTGSCSGGPSSLSAGYNYLTFSSLSYGTYSNCTVRLTSSGRQSEILNIPSFTVAQLPSWGGSNWSRGIATKSFNNNLIQVATNSQGQIFNRYHNGVMWSGWDMIDGETPGELELEVYGNNLYLSVRGGSGGVYTRSFNGTSWGPWGGNAGVTPGEIEMEVYNGNLFQTIRGESGGVFVRSFNGVSWTAWRFFGGETPGNIAMKTYNGRLYQAIRGGSGGIYTRSFDGVNWTPWSFNGGETPGEIAMEVYNGLLYQSVRGGSGGVYTRTFNGNTWDYWFYNVGETPGEITMKTFNGQLYQSMRGESGGVYTRITNGYGWGNWTFNGGETVGSIEMEVFNNSIYQAIRGGGGGIFTRTGNTSYVWAPWQQI